MNGADSTGPLSLSELGERICILGPSNSGKSTLAVAVGAATGLPVVHLDVLRHVPGAHWVERDAGEFGRLHDAADAEAAARRSGQRA